MLKFGNAGTSQVMIGLNRVGVAGLREALKKAAESGLTERKAIVNLLMDTLKEQNYIHDRQEEAYRTALWREYLRFRGKDFHDFLSEIEVTVRGEPGDKRDTFVKMLESVLAEFELKPLITYAAAEGGPGPELVIGGEVIVQGSPKRPDLKLALHKTISGW